ncbi:MAG: hypothetical protein JO180_01045 [Gemmatirosa sp.]|nr:hypothetical protein [Gemmatirosa sp.]
MRLTHRATAYVAVCVAGATLAIAAAAAVAIASPTRLHRSTTHADRGTMHEVSMSYVVM